LVVLVFLSSPVTLSRSLSGGPPALHSFPTRRSSDLLLGHLWRQRLLQDARIDRSRADRIDTDPTGEQLAGEAPWDPCQCGQPWTDRKSTRLNSSHVSISYAVFCLKNKNNGAELGPDT